jgi:predicted metalloprotease with PDZ domain
VTDYYGDVTLTRGGLWSVDRFINSVNSDLVQVDGAAEPVSAEDASINTWISPTYVDEAQYYYPKGSLLGLMLDIQIRDATANRHSLDEVMRTLWTDFYRRGRGFTTADLLGIIRPWFAGVDDFYARYVNGREPLPYQRVLPRGGIAVDLQETKVPFIGVTTGEAKDGGVVVGRVAANSLASDAGLQPGDILLRAGDVETTDPQAFGAAYRQRYTTEGEAVQLSWRRAGQAMTGRGTVKMRVDRNWRLLRDPNATPAARAILDGITR